MMKFKLEKEELRNEIKEAKIFVIEEIGSMKFEKIKYNMAAIAGVATFAVTIIRLFFV